MKSERRLARTLKKLANQYPVLTVTGPRQSGKTTLCQMCFPSYAYVSLETPDVREFALQDPRGFLRQYSERVIFDEIQRAPELLSYIQGMVDASDKPGQFVLTGSQQFELMRGVSQSLAGRTAVLRLLPFQIDELRQIRPRKKVTPWQHIIEGFMPRLHARRLTPAQAHADYFATYVERDLRALAAVQDLQRFERFMKLCAGRVGQLLNVANLAADAGVAVNSAERWLDVLQTSYILTRVQPWHTNNGKRLVKQAKLFFYDVGLAAWLLGLRSAAQVERDPLRGALFENLVVMEAMKRRWHSGDTSPFYFYRDSHGNEVDVMVPNGPAFDLIEIKSGETLGADAFKGLTRFEVANPGVAASRFLVYAGADEHTRNDVNVSGWDAPIYAASALAKRRD